MQTQPKCNRSSQASLEGTMKRQSLIVGAGIMLMLAYIAIANSGPALTEVKTPAGIERANTFKGRVSHSDTARLQPVTGQTETALSAPGAGMRASASANYQIPWLSINSGGGRSTSANYQHNGSFGQLVVGHATSTNYQMGAGYWYGAGGQQCNCGVWGDVSNDGHINPTDVVRMVNFVYKGQTGALLPPNGFNCPEKLGDANCSGAVNPVDVVLYVNFVYKSNQSGWCADPSTP